MKVGQLCLSGNHNYKQALIVCSLTSPLCITGLKFLQRSIVSRTSPHFPIPGAFPSSKHLIIRPSAASTPAPITMDTQQPRTSAGGQPPDPADASLLPTVSLPEDILRMIFTESMSKPAIHFASAVTRIVPPTNPLDQGVCAIHLAPWARGDIKSGYLATRELQKVCKLSRDVARTTTLKPALIRIGNGTVSADAASDIICFIFPRFWNRQTHSDFYTLRGIWPERDHGAWWKTLGGIRRTGVLVDKDMWYEVLRCWFIPGEDNNFLQYNRIDGRLGLPSILTMISIQGPRNILDFYVILVDVSVLEWEWSPTTRVSIPLLAYSLVTLI